MTYLFSRFLPLACMLALFAPVVADARADINPKAKEDLMAFMKKAEEADGLFYQKKYAEAAAALAAARELYNRAARRDDNVRAFPITLEPITFPALRYYGYGTGPSGGIREEPTGAIKTNAVILKNALSLMWLHASFLSDAEKGPLSYATDDPPMDELTEDALNSHIDYTYGEVRRVKLPVPDSDWRDVVLSGRRSLLLMEHALKRYPEWRTKKLNWLDQPTGDEVVADIKKKLAEAEPEYERVVAEERKAEPAGFAAAMQIEMETLNTAIAGVKRNGWLDYFLARDIFLDQNYQSKRHKVLEASYTSAGKALPEDKLKPLDDKIAELKSVVEQNAPRWHFPTGKQHNAAIEARAKSGILAHFPGATVLNVALDDTDWAIVKNDLGIPRYRRRDVIVLTKLPGQKMPWLIYGLYEQDYAGGGTYNTGGTFERFRNVRIQAGP